MTKEEFIEEVEFILNEKPGTLKEETRLAPLKGFDSTGFLGLIALFDGDLGLKVNVDRLRGSQTVAELIAMAGDKLTD